MSDPTTATFRFRGVDIGSVETELTQWDQFNSDELDAAEAVSRESHQNTLDAPAGAGPVRTKISVHEADDADGDYFEALFSPLKAHLAAAGTRFVPASFRKPRFLVVEDFGTTGLTGAWDAMDNGNFSDFWRRFGGSHKSGSKGGSWGLGKLAYPATSTARTFFGVTVRKDDPQALLMGQTVLRHHEIAGKQYVPFGFYSTLASDGLQLPITDQAAIERFSRAVGFKRTVEPGLSIAVPFVSDDLTVESLVQPLLKNYFFPILTGRLVIEVGDTVIDQTTFDDAVRIYGGDDFAGGHLQSFIGQLHKALRDNKPDVEFPAKWQYGNVEEALSPEELATVRAKFSTGDLVHIRVPLRIKTADLSYRDGTLDLAYRASAEGQKPRALFVRNSLTINSEARKAYGDRMAFAALVAADGAPAELLRASENPAHTMWDTKAQKLADHWDTTDAAKRIRQIKRLPREICDLLVEAREDVDENALINVFAIPDKRPTSTTRPRPIPIPPVPPIPPAPPAFRVTRRATGFVVKGTEVDELPKIKVMTAYDLVRGDPFKAFSPLDFDFAKAGYAGVEVIAEGAEVEVTAANVLHITPCEKEFSVEVRGFDTRRDLRVDVRRATT